MKKYHVFDVCVETSYRLGSYQRAVKVLRERDSLYCNFISGVDVDFSNKPIEAFEAEDDREALSYFYDHYYTIGSRITNGIAFYEYLLYNGEEVEAMLKALDECEDWEEPALIAWSTTDSYDEDDEYED